MKSIEIVFVQTKEEIIFVNKFLPDNILWIPLNLEPLLYLKKNNKNYLDLNKIMNNNFHRNALLYSEKLVKLAKNNFIGEKYLLQRYVGILRKYFNSIYFIIEILEKISKKNIIKKIYLSGFDKYDFNNLKNNYFVSRIVKEIFFKKYELVFLNDLKYENKNSIYSYTFPKKINYEYILLNNLGYAFKNFLRLNLFNKKILLFDHEKIFWLKKALLSILGVKFIKIKKIKVNKFEKIKFKLPVLNFFYKNYNLKNLINHRNKQIKIELYNLSQLEKFFLNFFNYKKPLFVALNFSRGINNFLIDYCKNKKIPCYLIPHGTLSHQTSKYGKIYNKIIAEEITSDNCFNCSQTKVSHSYFLKNVSKKNIIVSGNLIFSGTKYKAGKFYLYAVTSRDFVNTHFFGIETFYEFFKNLDFLNNQANKSNYPVKVKLHPNVAFLKRELNESFTNLNFSNKNLKSLLKKTIATISFSSTVIEDSLSSNIPVILFDQWQRYDHSAVLKKKTINGIKYLDSCKKLIKIFKMKKIKLNYNFNDLIYGDLKNNNFKRIFNIYLK